MALTTKTIKPLQDQFERVKELILDKVADNLDSDGDQILRTEFNAFVRQLEKVHARVFDDKTSEEKLLVALPGVEPYWDLIKEMRRHDGVMFATLDSEQAVTNKKVAHMVTSKETLQFIKQNQAILDDMLLGSKELYEDTRSNIKMLRVAQFVAYALSGQGTDLVARITAADPKISKKSLHSKIYKDFTESVHYLNVNDHRVRWYDIDGKKRGQPGRNITDGVVFGDAGEHAPGKHKAFMVFASAGNNMTTQQRQLFDHTSWFAAFKNSAADEGPISLRDVIETVPVLVCFPLVETGLTDSGLHKLFKHSTIAPKETEMFNSIPLLSQLGNIDNSDTGTALDTIMKTVYFTAGGGSSLEVHNKFQELLRISAPERHKLMLEVCAKKMTAIATTLSQKALSTKAKHLNQETLGQNVLSMMEGITAMANGIIKHSATFKQDPAFIARMEKAIGSTHQKLSNFTDKINEAKVSKQAVFDNFRDAIEKLEPSELSARIQRQKVAAKIVSLPTIDEALIKETFKTYIELSDNKLHGATPKRGPNTDFVTHFNRLIEHKVEYGEGATFTPSKGDGLTSTYQTILLRMANPESSNYDDSEPQRNKVVSKLFRILETKHTTEDIMESMNKLMKRVAHNLEDTQCEDISLGM